MDNDLPTIDSSILPMIVQPVINSPITTTYTRSADNTLQLSECQKFILEFFKNIDVPFENDIKKLLTPDSTVLSVYEVLKEKFPHIKRTHPAVVLYASKLFDFLNYDQIYALVLSGAFTATYTKDLRQGIRLICNGNEEYTSMTMKNLRKGYELLVRMDIKIEKSNLYYATVSDYEKNIPGWKTINNSSVFTVYLLDRGGERPVKEKFHSYRDCLKFLHKEGRIADEKEKTTEKNARIEVSENNIVVSLIKESNTFLPESYYQKYSDDILLSIDAVIYIDNILHCLYERIYRVYEKRKKDVPTFEIQDAIKEIFPQSFVEHAFHYLLRPIFLLNYYEKNKYIENMLEYITVEIFSATFDTIRNENRNFEDDENHAVEYVKSRIATSEIMKKAIDNDQEMKKLLLNNKCPLNIYKKDFKYTISITFGDRAENHAGMQKIGNQATEGYSYEDLKRFMEYIEENYGCAMELVSLHDYLPQEAEPWKNQAYILIVRNFVQALGYDCDYLAEHLKNLDWDSKAYMYGEVRNKHARHNLCFDEKDIEPNYENKSGRIVSWEKVPYLKSMLMNIESVLEPDTGNETIKTNPTLKGEGNLYYDVKNCGIGWHGDKERIKVAAVRFGASMDLCYKWYYQHAPVSEKVCFTLNNGDLYIMSEKAVGNDSGKSSIYTLRHSAGCKDYTVTPKKHKERRSVAESRERTK